MLELSICLSVCLSVCLSPKCKSAIFSKLSNWSYGLYYLWYLRAFQRTHYWSLKSKMAEIRHLDVIYFSAEGGAIWIKFRRLVQNNMSTAMIWSKSKPQVEFQYGGRLGKFNGTSSQSHQPHWRVLPPREFSVMIPELRVILQSAAIGRIQ